ncbi:MAG: hypothetical protein ACXIUD_09790 [Mongoliitalea sp.]
MTLNTREEKIKIIFAQYPNQKEIYMTSDDRAFFEATKADAYAQNLQDKKVSHITRKLWDVFAKAKGIDQSTEEGTQEPTVETETTEEGTQEPTVETETTEEGTQEPTVETESTEEVLEDTTDEEVVPAPLDRALLAARYEQLLGKKPTNFMKTETIAAKIAEAEASITKDTN